LSGYAKSRHDLLQEGIELGSRKLVALANQEFTAAEKNLADAAKSFAEREDKQIDAELKRRALESDIWKRQEDARKAKAEADLAEINVAQALYDFQKKLAEDGVALTRDPDGTLQFIRVSSPVQSDHELPSTK
jgi:hypothetical protein